MTYEQHKHSGEQLTPLEVDNMLRTLGRDERFCSVVAWIERNLNSFIAAGSRQNIAGDHGKLAHAQGSVHAMNILASQLANLLKPARVVGGIPDENPNRVSR